LVVRKSNIKNPFFQITILDVYCSVTVLNLFKDCELTIAMTTFLQFPEFNLWLY